LVQVNRPTDADLASARADMNEALERVGSHLRETTATEGHLHSQESAIDQVACKTIPI